jgi:hypothetical protein
VTRNQWYGAATKLAKLMLYGSKDFAMIDLPCFLVVHDHQVELDEPVNAADVTQIEPRACDIQSLVMETEAWMASLGC